MCRCPKLPVLGNNVRRPNLSDLTGLEFTVEKYITVIHDFLFQKSAITNATEESLREANFNAARIEHKRQQEKQRQVKREQQQLAEGLRHQLLQDNRR